MSLLFESYLGDGVYIGVDESTAQVVLYTSDGITHTNTIYFEEETMQAFMAYMRRLQGALTLIIGKEKLQ